MDWISLVVGGVVGAILGVLAQELWNKLNVKNLLWNRRRRGRKKLLEKKSLADWIEEYYESRGCMDDLYMCKIGKTAQRIPFLTAKPYSQSNLELSAFEAFFRFEGSTDREFAVNERILHRRRELGQKLFEEPTIYLESFVEGEDGSFAIVARSCGYSQMFSYLAAIEEETYSALRRGGHYPTPLRDEAIPNFTTAIRNTGMPVSIGCQVALVLCYEERREVLLQVRSYETATAGGVTAVIPVFGLSPLGESLTRDIITNNILKEYCEELYDYEELISWAENRRASDLWFLSLPEAKELRDALDCRLASIRFLGLGFDGFNGSLTLAFLLLIREDLAGRIKERIQANWEVAQRDSAIVPLEFVDLKSGRLEELLGKGSLHAGSAFTIDRAVNVVEEQGLFD